MSIPCVIKGPFRFIGTLLAIHVYHLSISLPISGIYLTYLSIQSPYSPIGTVRIPRSPQSTYRRPPPIPTVRISLGSKEYKTGRLMVSEILGVLDSVDRAFFGDGERRSGGGMCTEETED